MKQNVLLEASKWLDSGTQLYIPGSHVSQTFRALTQPSDYYLHLLFAIDLSACWFQLENYLCRKAAGGLYVQMCAAFPSLSVPPSTWTNKVSEKVLAGQWQGDMGWVSSLHPKGALREHLLISFLCRKQANRRMACSPFSAPFILLCFAILLFSEWRDFPPISLYVLSFFWTSL